MADEMRKASAKRSDRASRLERTASEQWGVVGHGDLRRADLDRFAIRRREQAHQLHPMFPGTWAVGHRALTREAWFISAVLSAGGDARVAGASACQLYEV